MSNIRVLLADDHEMVRKGLRSILDAEADLEVIGEAKDGREALKEAKRLLPDIVVMDITMPGLNGLDATRQLKKQFPQMPIVVLSMHTEKEYVLEVLRAGASGYVVKQAAPAELTSAIRAAQRGEAFLSPAVSKKLVGEYVRQAEAAEDREPHDGLTAREREVLQLIAEGHSNKEIAKLLFISVKTVETHRAHLMAKLDRHNVTDLTEYAIGKGMVGEG